MYIDKFNSERYYDPTPYQALTNVINEERKAKYRPVVYICSECSGFLPKDIGKAKIYSRFAVDNKAIPISPIILFALYMDKEKEQDLFSFMDMVMFSKCEELWVFGENITKQMKIKIDKAERKNKKIRYFTEECKEVI